MKFNRERTIYKKLKMTSSSILCINSKDRVTGNSSDYTYNFVQYGEDRVKNYRINKVTIPYSYYNIRTQSFTITQGEVTNTYTIPGGSYTINSLINKISSLIVTEAINLTYDPNTNKFTFTSISSFYIDFTNTQTTGTLSNYNLGFRMGFSNLTTPSATQITSDNSVNLNATINIYVASQFLSIYGQAYFNRNRAYIIQTVPIQVNSYSYIVWENLQQTIFNFDDRSINQFDLKLLDDNGNIIDLNGLDWTIEIEVYK